MAYGGSADRKLVDKFRQVCQQEDARDRDVMTRQASRRIVRVFWSEHPKLQNCRLSTSAEKVFNKLADKKLHIILVDGPHVEAYLTELAHEITRVQLDNDKLHRHDPNVTFCKALLEGLVRNTDVRMGTSK